MFQHFVITRFNLRDPALEKANGNKPLLDDKWMEDRLELFENYCYSSIKNQTELNFTWLVFFDISTPQVFRTIIDRYAAEFSNFTPIYIDGMNAYLPSIKSEVAKRLDQPYLITSRLDNDDCLHKDYMKEVQAQFAQQPFMAIDFIDGYTLQIEPVVRFAKRSHVHNPFISLIEKSDDFVTVWSRKRHGHWSKVKKVLPVQNKRMWMSIIHFENATNTFLGYGDIDWQKIKAFHIDANIESNLKQKNIPFNDWKKQSSKQQLKTLWKVYFKLFNRKMSSIIN